jgi:HD-like signal output (HDOD) protein
MHDIGRIVVLRGISALRKRDPQSFLVPAHTVREFTDALRCPIGDVLCHEWNIPAELRDAVVRIATLLIDLEDEREQLAAIF